MKNPRLLIVAAVGLVFVIGAGVIISRNMPVNQLTPEDLAPVSQNDQDDEKNEVETGENKGEGSDETPDTNTPTTDTVVEKPSTNSGANTFTMAQIQTHNTSASCWAAVEKNVYDLTTWISRHPGGAKPIERLCGTDATEAFARKHGGSSAAKAALALLKIGTLAQ